MDLALELGMPAASLSRVLTEQEFVLWGHYARKKALPARRVELYLAQLSLILAKTLGGAKTATLADFLLFEPRAAEDDGPALQMDAAAGAAALGAMVDAPGVYVLGRGRQPEPAVDDSEGDPEDGAAGDPA